MKTAATDLLGWVLTFLFVGLLALVLIAIMGCGRKEAKLSTGTVLLAADLPLYGFKGDKSYAVVQSTALPDLYANFRDALSKQGLVKWDARFDCNHFAALYVSLAQAAYTVAAWQSSSPAQTLALAEVWYVRGSGGGHAIVSAVTERGLLFIEPQTGLELSLTAAEQRSIYLTKW